MLVIHIGSQKTGTTAIQNFLKGNTAELGERNISFVSAGRTNIAHNSMVKPLLKGRSAEIVEAIHAEIDAQPGATHIISSEMFFQPAIAPKLADALRPAVDEIMILGYIRRQDSYAEAMYKQKVKNGRIPADPEGFLTSWGARLNYYPILNAYGSAFGQASLRIRPFERRQLKDGDVVADFVEAVGGGDMAGYNTPPNRSNKTLSRAVSEQLALVSRYTPFNTRAMIRDIIASGNPETMRSHDVYDKATRSRIIGDLAEDIAAVAALCFPDLELPFDMSDLDDQATDRYPSAQEQLKLERVGLDAVLAALGTQSKAVAPSPRTNQDTPPAAAEAP